MNCISGSLLSIWRGECFFYTSIPGKVIKQKGMVECHCFAAPNELMDQGSLMVANIINGETTKNYVLPDGGWFLTAL